ncbi:hypothetical protein J2X63_002062 [Agromyces sp. 3263]|uniref:hypothetical protein n=1 Tax=Agromyces sp. 3263 TaxID=2817750 RepID=UPI002857B673|nr:hypothetical protein [Agromyces sp. 3263]MDR6906376.1 hypothetical protein [Agromyces sp. 3263]
MPDASPSRSRTLGLSGRPIATFAVLVVTLLCATVGTIGVTSSHAEHETQMEAEARAAAVHLVAGHVGIGAAEFDPTGARITVDTNGARAALEAARAAATDATGKASAESIAALAASVDQLEHDLAGDGGGGAWYFPRVHELRRLRDAVASSAIAWQAAEEAAILAAAAEDDGGGSDGSSERAAPGQIDFDLNVTPGLIPVPPLGPWEEDPHLYDYACPILSGYYWSPTPCFEEDTTEVPGE